MKQKREHFKNRCKEEHILYIYSFIERNGKNATYGRLLGQDISRNVLKPLILDLIEKGFLLAESPRSYRTRRGGGASSRIILSSTNKGRELRQKLGEIVSMLTPRTLIEEESPYTLYRKVY